MALRGKKVDLQRRLAALLLLLSAASAFAAPPVDAPNLTGRWLHEDVGEDGNRSTIILALKQDHDKITGKVMFAWGDISIESGEVNGSKFRFIAMTPADSKQPAVYEGELKAGALEVHSHWPGNNNTDYSATRTSDTAGDPPARIPTPAIKSLPYNGLTATPPMGWNSWNHFQGKIDDRAVREIADAVVASGMRDAGYIYINIDDSWEGERDAAGAIHANRKFPDMKALADYVHGKGLKIGIYSSPGPKTCGGYEGSYGHEQQDARTYAQWGFDYLKYDWCSAGRIYGNRDLQAVYQKMGDALQNSGRPMVYSLCEYGMGDVWKWGPAAGANLWRTTGDITDHWSALDYTGFAQSPLAPYAAPGHWNDPDMLEIGNGGMSNIEYRTHMTLWAMLAAPLLAGNDPRTMSAEVRDILLNREVIAVDQDPLGKQATRVWSQGSAEAWSRPLADRSFAIAVFNRGGSQQTFDLPWTALKMTKPTSLRDLWAHRDLPSTDNRLHVSLPAHGSVMLRLRAE